MFGALLLFESEFLHVVAITFTALLLTELLMVALTIRTWHVLMVVSEIVSLGIYIISIVFLPDVFGKYCSSVCYLDIMQSYMILELMNYILTYIEKMINLQPKFRPYMLL